MTAKTPEEHIADLGLALPRAAAAVANYVPWVITGNLVMTSGNLPWRAGKLAYVGKIGREVSGDDGLQVVSAFLPECCRADQTGGRRAHEGEAHRAAGRGAQRGRRL